MSEELILGPVEEDLDGLLHEAEAFCMEHDYDGAIAILNNAVTSYPDSPLPHHALSVVYFSMLREKYDHLRVWKNLSDHEKWFELAVGQSESALQIDDNYVPAHNNLATLFALRGGWKRAIQHWEISLTLYPDQPRVREELAMAHEHVNES